MPLFRTLCVVLTRTLSRRSCLPYLRRELFANCYELQPTFLQLLARPTQLALVKVG